VLVVLVVEDAGTRRLSRWADQTGNRGHVQRRFMPHP